MPEIKAIFRSCVGTAWYVCIAPCKVGYHITQGKNPNSLQIHRQDGFISAWATFSVIISFMLFLSIAHFLSADKNAAVERSYVLICQSTLMLWGITFILVFLCCSRIRNKVINTGEQMGRISNFRDVFAAGGITDPTEYCQKITKKILPLIGIVIFLIGACVIDILRVIAYADCMDEYHANTEYHSFYLMEAWTEIIFHVFNIIFMFLVTFFCALFITVDIHLYKYKMTRINCVILLTSIIWLWFQTQLDDAKDAGLFEEKVTIDVCGGCVNDTKGLNDSCQCLCEKTDIFMNFDAASVYLYAFIVEYSLLVMECLLHIMLTMVDKTEHIPILPADVNNTVVVYDRLESVPESLHEHHHEDEDSSGDFSDCTDEVPVFVDSEMTIPKARLAQGAETNPMGRSHSAPENMVTGTNSGISRNKYGLGARRVDTMEDIAASEHSPLLPGPSGINSELHDFVEIRSCDSYNSDMHDVHHNECLAVPKSLLIPLFGFLLSTTIIIMTANGITDGDENPRHSTSYTIAYCILKLTLHVFTVVITKIGFGIARNFHSRHKGYSGFEMLLMFSTMGLFIYGMFIVWAFVASLIHPKQGLHETDKALGSYIDPGVPAKVLYSFDIIIYMWQAYTQSMFMLHISKLSCPVICQPWVSSMFKNILLALTIINLCIWFQCSFLELKNITVILPIQADYYGHDVWTAISHLIYPILMFYRFNSFICFLGLLLSY